MSSLRQIVTVTAINLLSVHGRLGGCLVITIGMAGAVAVFISVFAMERSLAETVSKTGRADRAIVLGKGAESESDSGLSRSTINAIFNTAPIRNDGKGAPIASAEAIVLVTLTDKAGGLDSFATLRGAGPDIFALRPEIKLTEGRLFKAGLPELIVGKSVNVRLKGLNLGDRLSLPGGDWTVVGVFSGEGDSLESELVTDAVTLLSAYQRNTFNSVTVLLDDPEHFDIFKDALLGNPSVSVEVIRERDYLREVSKPTVALLSFISSFIGGLMLLGALFASIDSMYAAVSARTAQIATLRALGFSGVVVTIPVFVELLVFTLLGAVIGAVVARLSCDGMAVSTLVGAGPAPVSYTLNVNAPVIVRGIGCACAVGFLSGLLPAVRAARISVSSAFRSA